MSEGKPAGIDPAGYHRRAAHWCLDAQAELLGEVRRWGSVQREDHAPEGTLLQARVPQHVADKLSDLHMDDAEFRARRLALLPALAGTKPW